MSHNRQKCINCNHIPEEVLVLSCHHCICLACASYQAFLQSLSRNFIVCLCCGQSTDLPQIVLNELAKIYKKKKNPRTGQNVYNKQLLKFQQTKKFENSFDLQKTCQFHHQHPIMYICKSCNKEFVCPECLINGIHKGHQATPIEQQTQFIKSELQTNLSKINIKITQFEQVKIARIKSANKKRQELQYLKESTKKKYEAIRQGIDNQQISVLTKFTELLTSFQKQDEQFRLKLADQIKIFEQRRNQIVDILNPLLERNTRKNKNMQKLLMINLIQSYNNQTKIWIKKLRKNHKKMSNQLFFQIKKQKRFLQTITLSTDKHFQYRNL